MCFGSWPLVITLCEMTVSERHVSEVGVGVRRATAHQPLHVLHVERVDELGPQLVEHDLHDPRGSLRWPGRGWRADDCGRAPSDAVAESRLSGASAASRSPAPATAMPVCRDRILMPHSVRRGGAPEQLLVRNVAPPS